MKTNKPETIIKHCIQCDDDTIWLIDKTWTKYLCVLCRGDNGE